MPIQTRLFEKKSPNKSPILCYERTHNAKSMINLIDLFAGIGGFHYGVEAAASQYGKSVKAVIVSEIDETCKEVYENNFNCKVLGDINKIQIHDFANTEIDIITAGFPCQPFSNSGKKLGMRDPRGQFYNTIESFIKRFTPKSFILENVSGIKNSGGGSYKSKLAVYPAHIGRTLSILEGHLIKLTNYNIKWIELDSSNFGSPQVRRRVFIIGVHKDFGDSLDFRFPIFQINSFMSVVKEIYQEDLELNNNQKRNILSFMNKPPSYQNGMRRVGQAYLCKGGNVGQGYHAHGLVPTLTKVWAKLLPIYFPNKNETLPVIKSRSFIPNEYYGKGYLRKASANELARLQGFPKFFIPHERFPVAAEHLGNAVNAKVVSEIVNLILQKISDSILKN